jgi:hypothetical protein
LKTNNPFLFWVRTETIPIISCHGCIRLPVWSWDQLKGENPSLSADSYTISNTWWSQYRIASYGEYQTVYGTVDGVDFQQGLPTWII